MLAAVLRREQSGGLPLDGGCDEDRAGPRGALDPRGDIRRIAEHFARCVDHNLPGIKADPRGKLRRALLAFLALISTRARWIASAARTARSASFSCACG